MYQYSTERPKLFNEEGRVTFLKIRDHVANLVAQAGAVQMDKAISVVSRDSWLLLACVDRLVELGELAEVITQEDVAAQQRVFVAGIRFPGKWR